ncbi:MAG: hypothetical protein LBH06_08295 [Rikenellaceae bacterium]|jgi:hypothetical protein|nr:hypothetical protein [Rikenellaceae bacterium]
MELPTGQEANGLSIVIVEQYHEVELYITIADAGNIVNFAVKYRPHDIAPPATLHPS